MKFFHRSKSRFWRGGIFIFVWLLFAARFNFHAAASASGSSFLQRSWQADQGVPHTLVNSVLQTRDGYLWVGTRRGCARFDGIRFTPLEIPEVKAQIVLSMCEGRDRSLWLATEGGVFRLRDGKTIHYRQADGLADDNVRTVFEGKDGSIWMGTANGLSQFQNEKFRSFRRQTPDENVLRSLCEDETGALWIATDGGLCRFNDGVFTVPEIAQELGKGMRVVCLDGTRNLCVGTEKGLFRRAATGWEHFDKMKSGLSDDFISALYLDRSGRLWIGTYSGLNWLEHGKLHTELTAERTAFDQVNGVFQDREENIWVGSKDGLTRLRVKSITAITKQHGLTYNNAMSVLEDRRGIYWCGTWGGGLFRVEDDGSGGFIIANPFPNSRILSLLETRDASLWFGADQGVGLFQMKDGAVMHYHDKDGLSVGPERIPIPVLHEDREGNLWLGTSSALVRFKDGKFTYYTTKDGLAGNTIRVIYEDKEGSLWIGTNTGLSRRKNGEFTNFTTADGLPVNVVVALYEDAENTLWIGTAGGGLARIKNEELKNKNREATHHASRFTTYTTKDGLLSDNILEVLEDDYGYLWMSCLNGIFRINKKDFGRFDRGEVDTIPCTSYGKDDGMLSVVCSNVAKPASWKARNGRLWFPTTKGLVVADPNIKANDTPPPVVIEEILADKKPVSESLSRATLSKNVKSSLARPLEIPAGRGEVEIHYSALSFSAPEKNRFKYKLEGVDPEWVEADTRRVAYYNNLAPGHYTFRVMGCNNHSVWNSLGENVKFTLLPRFWQTLWFKLSVVALGLGVVASAARIVTQRRMQFKLVRLEQQHAIEKERTRIAQDMHDDLGVRLSEILLLSNMAEKESRPDEAKNLNRKISHASRELVDNLDAIVWAVNPKNDSLETFVHYLYEFAPRYLQMSGIRCLFDTPMDLPDHPLPSEVRHNLFLVVKESLYNIVKHAHASEVKIRLALEDEFLFLSISDNGCGFAAKADSAFGNGLHNMQQRMARIGGTFDLTSEPAGGTRIQLKIPLRSDGMKE